MKFVIAPIAAKDITAIWEYIAEDNIDAADALIDAFYDTFRLLAENPKAGHYQDALRKFPFRFWTVKKRYQIIYRENNPLQIARVLSGYRDIFAILEEDAQDKQS